MSKKSLRLTTVIEANKLSCGECRFLLFHERYCLLFDDQLKPYRNGWRRLDVCRLTESASNKLEDELTTLRVEVEEQREIIDELQSMIM